MLTFQCVHVHTENAGLWMLFIRHTNKSYTFNPDLMHLVPDVTKIPKLLPYEKTTIIKKWNSKWTQIAPQLPQLSMVFEFLVFTSTQLDQLIIQYCRSCLLQASLKGLLFRPSCPLHPGLLSSSCHSTACLFPSQLQLPHAHHFCPAQ